MHTHVEVRWQHEAMPHAKNYRRRHDEGALGRPRLLPLLGGPRGGSEPRAALRAGPVDAQQPAPPALHRRPRAWVDGPVRHFGPRVPPPSGRVGVDHVGRHRHAAAWEDSARHPYRQRAERRDRCDPRDRRWHHRGHHHHTPPPPPHAARRTPHAARRTTPACHRPQHTHDRQ